ncbi:hypothetical protein D3C71_1369400 [compost metagenome]
MNKWSLQQIRVVRDRDLGVEPFLRQTWTQHAEVLGVVLVHVFHRHFDTVLRYSLAVFEGRVTQYTDGEVEQTRIVYPTFHTYVVAFTVNDFIHR